MKHLLSLALILMLASPAQAFSLRVPVKKAGHAFKIVAKKAGDYALYGVALALAFEFCAHGGCD